MKYTTKKTLSINDKMAENTCIVKDAWMLAIIPSPHTSAILVYEEKLKKVLKLTLCVMRFNVVETKIVFYVHTDVSACETRHEYKCIT